MLAVDNQTGNTNHTTPSNSMAKLQLLDLPPELLLLVVEYLEYPDALALKFVNSTLQAVVEPTMTIGRRVEWLIDRADRGLTVPRWSQLNLRNDQGFTSNGEVRRMLLKRRQHHDCRSLTIQLLDEHYNPGMHWPSRSPSREIDTSWLRCAINPNVRLCRGIMHAHHQFMALDYWDDDNDPVDSSLPSSPQHGNVNQSYLTKFGRVIRNILWYAVNFVPAVVAGILYLNRLRLKTMFKIWMVFEALVLTIVLVHFCFGIEYSDMLEHGRQLMQRLEWITMSPAAITLQNQIWSLVKRYISI